MFNFFDFLIEYPMFFRLKSTSIFLSSFPESLTIIFLVHMKDSFLLELQSNSLYLFARQSGLGLVPPLGSFEWISQF
jgi:hypothetical protein